MAPASNPLVSIIIPAYHSQQTIAASLGHICAQSYRPVEVIVVDSSPDDATGRIVCAGFPQVTYRHHPERLLPHAARSLGVGLASGELLLFTDPDIYPPLGWVAELVKTYRQKGGVSAGALTCYGADWLARGIHLCKFDIWLPGGPLRRVEVAPTANLLCSRADFLAVGGFEPDYMLGDTLISWAWQAAGIPVWFNPRAFAAHHHTSTWRGFLRERYWRGAEFASLRQRCVNWGPARLGLQILASLLPFRLVKLLGRGWRNARAAGLGRDFIRTSPVVVSGQAAWLVGELAGYLGFESAGVRRCAF